MHVASRLMTVPGEAVVVAGLCPRISAGALVPRHRTAAAAAGATAGAPEKVAGGARTEGSRPLCAAAAAGR